MGLFRAVPCPIAPRQVVAERLREFASRAVHIATDGPIGRAVRRYCLKAGPMASGVPVAA
jgi:hypothetical protein